MEHSEREVIRKNLPKLVEDTICSDKFLSIFLSKNTLSRQDVEKINAQGNNHRNLNKSYTFYSIIVTRSNAFEVLLEALKETNQSGALTILKQNTSPSPKSSKTRKILRFDNIPHYMDTFLNDTTTNVMVVSSKDCQITCERILETVPNAIHFTLKDFIEFISTPEGRISTSNVSTVNCDDDLDSVFCYIHKVKAKVVLITSLLIDELKKSYAKPKKLNVLPHFAEDTIKWDDLSPGYQQQLKNDIKQQLQMEQNDKYFDEDDIDSEIMIDIMKGKPLKLFNDTLPEEIKYYIPRRLVNRRLVSHEIFKKGGQDIYLFENIERRKLSELAEGHRTETSSTLVNSSTFIYQFVILEQPHHFEKISEKYNDRPVHVLSFAETHFLWKKSTGSIHNIQTSLNTDQVVQKEEDFLEDIISRECTERCSTCISDTPGMGKSLLLAHFARTLGKMTDRVVNFVVISEFVKIFKESTEKSPDNKAAILSALFKYLCRNKLGEKFLVAHANKMKELMFDGFDELSSEDISLSYKILQTIQSEFKDTRIWITTRPHMFLELEKVLLVLGSNIQPFAELDQTNFLISFWCRNYDDTDQKRSTILEAFAKSCLASLKSAVKDKEEDIAGIPLQCMLIGEVFDDEAKQHYHSSSENDKDAKSFSTKISITSIVSLYERLIDNKIAKFHKRYGVVELDYSNLIKMHTFLSIWLLFPRCRRVFKNNLCPKNFSTAVQQVFNVGILESRSVLPAPRFIHRTFAEYFVAKFIVESLSVCPNQNVLDFAYKHVLKTIVHNFKINKSNLKTHDFKHNVVCYFIDALLSQLPKINVDTVVSPKAETHLTKLTEACAYNDFPQIYLRFVHKYATHVTHRKSVYTEKLLQILICRGSELLFEKAYQNFKLCNSVPIAEIKHDEYTLLHFAVIRGNFSLVENLLSKEKFKELLLTKNKAICNIIHECVRETRRSNLSTLNDKISIISYLTKINEDLLVQENLDGDLPIECKNVNSALVCHLFNCGKVLIEKKDFKLRIVHNLTKTLNSKEYGTFMKLLTSGEEESFVKDMVNSKFREKYLLDSIFLRIEPENDLMDLFKLYGTVFTKKSSHSRAAIHLAVKHKRSADCIKWLLNNTEWNNDDITTALTLKAGGLFIISALLEKGDIDLRNFPTLFHFICNRPSLSSEHLKFIQDLISKDVAVSIKDNNSKTAIDYLLQSKCNRYSLEVFDLLQSASKNSIYLECQKIYWVVQESHQADKYELFQYVFTNGKENWEWDSTATTWLHLVMTTKSVDATNNKQETPLHLLTQKHNFCIESWKFLVDKNADILAKDMDNNTPVSNLSKFSSQVFTTAMSYVIQHIDNDEVITKFSGISYCDSYNNTLLHLAAKHYNFELLQFLLKASCNVNAVNKHKQIPLHCVFDRYTYNRSFSLECWKVLVDYGADIFALNKHEQTPVCQLKYVTLEDISPAVMYVLTKFSQNISSTERVMWLVIKNFDLEVVKCACDWYKTNFQLPLEKVTTTINDTCSTLLDVALESANGDVLEYVLQDLKCSTLLANSPAQSVFTCLRNCDVNFEKRLKFLKVVTEQYSSLDILNSTNEDGLVPLSVKGCDESFVQPFVELGANVNARDADDNTPLHWSLKHNTYFPSIKLIEQLIKCGADVNAINKQHEFPLLLTLRLRYYEDISKLISLLIINNADPCKTDSSGNNILHWVLAIPGLENKHFSDFLKCILDKGYNDLFKSRNDAGCTPLEIAKRHKITFSREIIQILRHNHIDV